VWSLVLARFGVLAMMPPVKVTLVVEGYDTAMWHSAYRLAVSATQSGFPVAVSFKIVRFALGIYNDDINRNTNHQFMVPRMFWIHPIVCRFTPWMGWVYNDFGVRHFCLLFARFREC
jgi:hypothetical protein